VLVLGVAITGGASFPVVKSTVGEVSPPRLVGWRFVVATVTLLTLRPRVLYDLNRRTLTRGSVLEALLGIGFVLCTVGMQTTWVLISAFVIGTTVVSAHRVGLARAPTDDQGSRCSVSGFRGAGNDHGPWLRRGARNAADLGNSVLWAAHLVALERWSRVDRLHSLMFVQVAASAAVALGCLLVFEDQIGEAFAIVEHPIEPHVIVEPHGHRDEDELSYVVAVTIWARVVSARPKPCRLLGVEATRSHAQLLEPGSGAGAGARGHLPGFERLFEDSHGSRSALPNLVRKRSSTSAAGTA
jgi:hypothetical protein